MYSVDAMDCLFCKIAEGKIPTQAVYQDERIYAFPDINPQAPVHVLIIPREHIASLHEAEEHHVELLGHMLGAAAEIARQKGLGKGYRVVTNVGPDGGQSVEHLHLHVLGGRAMTWPPG